MITELERRVLSSPQAGKKFMDKFLVKVSNLTKAKSISIPKNINSVEFVNLLISIEITKPFYQVNIVRKSYQGAHSLEVK